MSISFTYNLYLRDVWRNKVMYSYGPPHMAVQKQDDQH